MSATTTQLLIFSVLFIILTSSNEAKDISPANFIISGLLNENQVPLTLSSADFNSKKIENISSTYVQYNSNNEMGLGFAGMVIYYKTGVIYGNYLIEESENTYSSYLMAINSTSGKILIDRIKYIDSLNTMGLAIDQYSGDIHFLNHTKTLDQNDRYTVDWCVWNVETQITSIIQKNANTNETANGAILFNPIDHSLYTKPYSLPHSLNQITVYNPVLYPTNAVYYTSLLDPKKLAINPKNGELFAIHSLTENEDIVLYLSSLHLNPVQRTIELKNICHYNTNHSIITIETLGVQNPTDFDYYSNSWAISFITVSGGVQTQLLLSVQIDSCDYSIIINENSTTEFFGALRFHSPDFNVQ